MPFSEKHRQILMVLGGGVMLLFLVWLFYLRGNANRTAREEANFNGEISKNIKKYADKNATAAVSELAEDYRKATKELQNKYQETGKKFLFPTLTAEQTAKQKDAVGFPTPLIPAEVIPQNHVRIRLRDERDYAARILGTTNRIAMSEQAQTLGMDLPAELQETELVDENWMRQIITLRRFVDCLQELKSEEHLQAIDELRPLPAVTTGTPPEFLREYPVEARLRLTHEGLTKLLAMFSQKKHAHGVRFLEISSAAPDRDSSIHVIKDDKKQKRIFKPHHYFSVHLVVATIEEITTDAEKSDSRPRPAEKPRIKKPILH